jgi:hypothetical protein
LIGNPIFIFRFFFTLNFLKTGDNGGHSGEKSTPKDNDHSKPTPGDFKQILLDIVF